MRRLALIGPNAVRPAAQGGGSAHVNPGHIVSPLEGLARVLGDDVGITVHPGVFPRTKLDALTTVTDPVGGEPGVRLRYLDGDGSVLSEEHRDPALWWFPLILDDAVTELSVQGVLELQVSGGHRLSVLGAGEFTLLVPGQEPRSCDLRVDDPDVGELALNPPSHTFVVSSSAGSVPFEIRYRPQRDFPYPIALLGLGYAEPRGDDATEFAAAVEAAR
ncbi:hypothetical protein ACFQ07_13220, partial [Actinomadura adrarensis]